jgi:nucleotide-binding universal stress UspA family protein
MDVMVRLYGNEADLPKLAAADVLARAFDGYLTVLFINVLPVLTTPSEWNGDTPGAVALLEAARKMADEAIAAVDQNVKQLRRPVEIRRFDALAEDAALIVAREARTADVFLGARPGSSRSDTRHMVETVLFESGRHVLLIPEGAVPEAPFRRAVIAWNGSREAARSVAEATPYLEHADAVAIVVATDGPVADEDAAIGTDIQTHLRHNGIEATLRHVEKDGSSGAALLREARRLDADLIVMGGYGHWRLREWLLGGTTRELMREAPIPLVMAH